MPGYGISAPDEGTGLLPWTWAEEHLVASRDFWLATLHRDGRPHVMPVWAVWDGRSLWFSTAPSSRKAHNLARDPRATVTTDDAEDPLVLEGRAERVSDEAANRSLCDQVNAKYATAYDVDFFLANATFRLQPTWAFGLVQADFGGSPTRWRFPDAEG